MEYTYGVSPHVLVIINDQAAEHIFGDNILFFMTMFYIEWI